MIERLGGEVIVFPTITINPPESFAAFDAAMQNLASYDWLIFTSVNSIEPFLQRLEHGRKTLADIDHVKIAAIGSETAKRLEAVGIAVSLVPARYQAEGILETLDAKEVSGKRVLIPRAAKARDLLPETLRRWGAKVDVVEAYRTVASEVDGAALRKRLRKGDIDLITFTSSSTVSHFLQRLSAAALSSVVNNAAIACIGPITAKTVEAAGGRVAILAREFTIAGLVEAIVEYYAQRVSRAEN